MFKSVRGQKRSDAKAEIQIAPLIDCVFLLLIFSLINTSFISETAVSIERPTSQTAEVTEKDSIFIGIGSGGQIYVAGRRVGIFSLRPLIESKLRTQPELSAILVADKAVSAGLIVEVMDELRLGGVKRIALSTEEKTQIQ